MKNVARTLLVMTVVGSAGLSGQESAMARAQRTLPPEVFANLSTLASEMSASGIPDEPLFNKALEGMAKRVPINRLMPAVRAYAGRLGQARGALGATASVPLLVAGADAIRRGVPSDALRSLPSDRPRSPVAVLVLAELLESGVPTERALDVLRQAMEQRTRDARMLDIPVRVRTLIRSGVPPQEAMDRVRRAMRNDRGGRMGPAVPPGDGTLADRRRLLDRLRRPGG
jgi:hypothetical protein